MKKAILISLILITLTGCRTVKKDWVKDNYVEKSEIQRLENSIEKLKQTTTQTINERIDSKYTAILNEMREAVKVDENETTTVSGTIEAEEGKEKSATIGNTTIKSNGSSIKFETTLNKAFNKELETINSKIEQTIEQYRNSLKTLENDFTTYKESTDKELAYLKSELDKKNKQTDKKGFSFTFVVILGIAVLIYIFRKRILDFFKAI